MTVFKGKMGEESQGITETEGWVLHHSPRHANWLMLSPDVALPVWFFCGIAKGLLEVES